MCLSIEQLVNTHLFRIENFRLHESDLETLWLVTEFLVFDRSDLDLRAANFSELRER